MLWGQRVAQIQGLGDDCAFTLWWLVGRQDLVQLEFFHHTTPPQRAVADRAPNDLGWSRFGIAVPDFEPALERLAGLGVEPLSEPLVHDGLRRACFRDPYTGALVEVLEEGASTPGGIRPRFYDLVPAVVYATINVPDLAEARRFFVETLGLAEEPRDRAPPARARGAVGPCRRSSARASSPAAATSTSRSCATTTRQAAAPRRLSAERPRLHERRPRVPRGGRCSASTYERVVANGYRDNFRAAEGRRRHVPERRPGQHPRAPARLHGSSTRASASRRSRCSAPPRPGRSRPSARPVPDRRSPRGTRLPRTGRAGRRALRRATPRSASGSTPSAPSSR